MPIKAFILVQTGGDYSDWYHNNLSVFLSREEAEAYIAEENRLYYIYRPYSIENLRPEDFHKEWNKDNGRTGKQLTNEEHKKRYAWCSERLTSFCYERLSEPDCELNDWQQVILINNNYKNPHNPLFLGGDIEIEEVDITENSRLWRLLSEQQEKNQ